MSKTKIEWADMTINPIIGCSKCSPGCDNCYAERMAARLARLPATAKRYSFVTTDGKWNGRTSVSIRDDPTIFPVKPKRVFVGSMGDVFHDSVSERDIQSLFEYMQLFPHHTFMLLTKRPERMRYLVNFENDLREQDDEEDEENRLFKEWPLPNVQLGVTVCNQQEADEKIPILLATPAAKRFVSIEPMLGPVSLACLPGNALCGSSSDKNALTGKLFIYGNCGESSQAIQGERLDWVICGAETGSGARLMNPDWARSIRDQCKTAGVPFFFKQMSGKALIPDDLMVREFPS